MPYPLKLRASHVLAPSLVSQAPASRYDWTTDNFAGNLAMLGGTHAITVTRIHAAANLALAGGTASNIQTRKLTSANLAFAGGADHVFIGRAHTAGNLALAGGAAHFFNTKIHTAGQLSLLGGTATLIGFRVVALSAGQITLASGSYELDHYVAPVPDQHGGRADPEEPAPTGMARRRDATSP